MRQFRFGSLGQIKWMESIEIKFKLRISQINFYAYKSGFLRTEFNFFKIENSVENLRNF
jgi:hypothetical protein